jgi:hypothetical protein
METAFCFALKAYRLGMNGVQQEVPLSLDDRGRDGKKASGAAG